MSIDNTVLSLNPDGRTLCGYESALRADGFKVISVRSPLEARFEIEMGRCGIFLTSYITPLPIYRDLARLFRDSCPGSFVVFLKNHAAEKESQEYAPKADLQLTKGDEPHALLESIRSMQAAKAS